MIHALLLAALFDAPLTPEKLKADSLACEAVYTKSVNFAIDAGDYESKGKKTLATIAEGQAHRAHDQYIQCNATVGAEIHAWLVQIGLVQDEDASSPDASDAPTPES